MNIVTENTHTSNPDEQDILLHILMETCKLEGKMQCISENLATLLEECKGHEGGLQVMNNTLSSLSTLIVRCRVLLARMWAHWLQFSRLHMWEALIWNVGVFALCMVLMGRITYMVVLSIR